MNKILVGVIIVIITVVGVFMFIYNVNDFDNKEVSLANPASTYCLQKGGSVDIRKRGDGGKYGVCVFEDNKQCEEWAMLRGNCKSGGIKVTGYDTDAQRYCAISGGKTIAQADANCIFDDGLVCNNIDLFNGDCELNNQGYPVLYQCLDNKIINAIFYENRTEEQKDFTSPPIPYGSVRLNLSDDRFIELPKTLSASGLRYANDGESIIFWSKGKKAFLVEDDIETYSDCVEE